MEEKNGTQDQMSLGNVLMNRSANEMEEEKETQDQMLLEDVLMKRWLERADELKQIDSLGKVETLKTKLDRKLGRNLALKLSKGPLERKRHTFAQVHSMKEKGGRERRFPRNISFDRQTSDYLIGHNVFPLKSMAWNQLLQQEEELKELEKIGIVQSKSNHSKVKNHIRNRVRRMCNHRITIKPSSSAGKRGKGTADYQTKSSILVTSIEDGEDKMRQLYRQQSRILIENMIQFPSHQQRVLEKLSLEQQRRISVVEVAKLFRSKVNWELQEQVSQHSCPPLQPMADMVAASLNQPISETTPPLEVASSLLKVEKLRTSGACHDHFDKVVGKESGESCMSKDDEQTGVTIDVSGRDIGMEMKNRDLVAMDTSKVMPANISLASDGEDIEGDVNVPPAAVVHAHSAVCDGNATATAPLSVSSPLHTCHFPPLPLSLPALDGASSSNRYKLTDEEDSLSLVDNSAKSSQTSPAKPALHVSCFSSPQLPLSIPSHFPCLLSTLSTHTSRSSLTHGTYETVEVEINPFALEFQLGPRSDGVEMRNPPFSCVNKLRCKPLSPQSSISSQFSDTLLSPTCLTVEYEKKCIPSKAFLDPDFLLFVKELGYTPTVSDYITYKMRVIGDKIEKRYSKELNQAMDEIFYEVIKKNLSWTTFSSISRKLLVGGARIQDGILLVPCFSRRLMDFVPHLGNTIVQFTERILYNYAADSIHGMGGWSSLMESYEEYCGGEEGVISAIDLDLVTLGHLCSSTPSSPTSLRTTRDYTTNGRKDINGQSLSMDLFDVQLAEPELCIQTSQNFALRKSNSVEVLFIEDEEVLEMDVDIPNGFKIIGHANLGNNQNTEHSSNSDSTSHLGNGGTTFSELMFTKDGSACTHPDKMERGHKRSFADIVAPLVMLTAHLVLLGCYLLKE